MKKEFTLLFIFLLSINIANAGETFEIDFTKSPSYILGLQEGDRVLFELNNSRHTILIKKIAVNKVDLATFTYLDESNTPFYTAITNKKYMKLDVDRDTKPDLYVLYENGNSTSSSLRFQLPLSSNKDLEIYSENRFKQTYYWPYIYFIIFGLLILFVLYLISLKFKNKESHSEKNPNSETKKEEKNP